jgi:hypothetical protein
MPDYRLYWLDSANHFIRAEQFAADDDAAAVEQARTLCDGQAAELWTGSRRIITFPASSDDADPNIV